MHTSGESSKPYCYTIDAIMAIFYLLLKGKNGEAYNVANPNTYTSIRGMAEMLSQAFNSQSKVIVKLKSNMGYAPITKLRLNVDKLKQLGWEPYFSLEEMFDRLIEYYKENEKTKLSVSMMCADLVNLEHDIRILEMNHVDYLHIDIMDASFVPNLTFGPDFVNAIRNITTIPLDIHLLMEHPRIIVRSMNIRENDIVTIHCECKESIMEI